ncbi:MAG: signal recognition particle protein [Mycoplasmoidaceae bacterium]|nr:MAG: signal recognition particle protein [Mycoplasmoidaceae bacterium]
MLKAMLTSIVAKHFKKKLDSWTIKEEDVNEVLREIRNTLLDADVNLLVVKNFIKSIRDKVVGSTLSQGQDPQQYILTIIKEELITILGKKTKSLDLSRRNLKIMFVGLQGSGKTTTCAKLANHLIIKNQKKPLLVGIDVYRPAAIEQLKILANEIKCDFFDKGTQNPAKTADEALTLSKTQNNDVVIFDTAGRLQTDDKLMQELKDIRNKVNPDEIIFIADAMSGQEIINVATEFNKHISLTGFIITKLDGDARAGAALSLTSLLNVPIIFIGTGERVGSLEQFYPERMADRILGLGDVMTLAEKARDVIDEQQTKKSFARMLAGKMDLEDLMMQMAQVNKLGSLSTITKMVPGAGNISENQIEDGQKKLKVWNVLLSSMTLKERRNPTLFKKESSRKLRVIKGSGRSAEEFNKLIKEWESSKERMQELGKKLMRGQNPLSGLM